MRRVFWNGCVLAATDDPDGVFADFLGCAVCLGNLYGRPLADELAERFAPDGSGMIIPDTFVAYRVRTADDLPDEYLVGGLSSGWTHLTFTEAEETWALASLSPGGVALSALVEGAELRGLLDQMSDLLRVRDGG
ncbi:hypothetical protein [Actinocorallia libanotica]|uniref:Uncharacterized protein n=1 Tax=Actinocorallia libanotica TaxID=46162 RepID=A0ABP4CK23_9ACTN